jgi:hypothetical protein
VTDGKCIRYCSAAPSLRHEGKSGGGAGRAGVMLDNFAGNCVPPKPDEATLQQTLLYSLLRCSPVKSDAGDVSAVHLTGPCRGLASLPGDPLRLDFDLTLLPDVEERYRLIFWKTPATGSR